MRVINWLPIERICSLALVLLMISTSQSISQPLTKRGISTRNPSTPKKLLPRLERRARPPLILPIPLYWGVDWNFIWYFVDPDRISPALYGLSPEEYQNIDNKHAAVMRQGALQAATQAVEVYYLLHPEAAVSALAEIRRLAILESQPDLPEGDKEEEKRLKDSIWDFFQQNPSLKANTAAIFLANVPERDKAALIEFNNRSGASSDDAQGSGSTGVIGPDGQSAGREPVVKDWAHVKPKTSETEDEPTNEQVAETPSDV